MATSLIPNDEKQAFISLVQSAPIPGGAFEASRLQNILVYYSDVYTAIMRQLELFASNNAYLTQGLACFNQDELQDVGIWFNTSFSSPPLVNPILIANCTLTDNLVLITYGSPPPFQYLCILGTSNLAGVSLEPYANLLELYIGPGVIVDILDASQPGALLNTLTMPFIKSLGGTLNAAQYGSQINFLNVDEGSYFGGFTNENPEATCAAPVQGLATVNPIVLNSIQIRWGPPDQQSPPLPYLFLNIYYRVLGSSVWILADESVGQFIGSTGFNFTNLEGGTNYEVMVSVTCLNGGVADCTPISFTAPCCAT